ncbi:MAG: CHAT domain-containing protein [Bryobacteraceae bacterium]
MSGGPVRTLAIPLAILAFAVSCSRPLQPAEEIFAKAQTAFDDERYEQALTLIPSDAVLREMNAGRGLRDRFGLLQAELLAMRPDSGPGLALLAQPFARGVDPELDRRRRRSLGYGKCRTARTAEERQTGMAMLDAVLGESPSLSAEAGNVQLRRGACLRAMEQFAQAEAAFQAALQAAKASREALLEAQVLSELGSLCASGERFDEAAVHTRGALLAAERAGAVGRHVTRRATDNLGWHQLGLGDYERAMDTFRKFQPMHDRERVVNENNQARTLLEMDDLAGAEVHFEKALATARASTNINASQQVASMQGLAAVSYRRGKWFEAARWNRDAMELIGKLGQPDMERSGVLTDARIRLAQGDAAGAEPVLRRLLADSGSSRQVRWTAHTELARLLAGLSRPTQAEAEFQKAMRLVEEAQATLTAAEDRISFLSGRMDVYRESLQFLLQQNRTDDALRIAERSRARALQDKSARHQTRKGATVLFYWLDEPASHLWVVGQAKGPAYFRLPGAKEIQDLVERHNQFVLRARNPLTENGQEARQLFEILVKPAMGLVRSRRVLISPDGALHALNFETLIAPGPDRYWLDDVEISVVPGLTAPAGGWRPHSKQILLAGDAVAGEAGYAPLRHAGDELDRIAEQFNAVPLKKEAATPQAVRDGMAKQPAYVHFAAHAQANRLRPLESAILLSPDGTSHKLYAREVTTIPMRAHLVTLSACTAAGAKAFRGEGLVGFAWAFLGAGAENVVASLWEVDDASTPQLMAQMYRQLQLGRSPPEALREAKLALLRSGTALQKPYFWGAFLHFQQ